MIESLKNIFKIPELRNRILFTLGMLAIYRLGSHIPTPGVDARALTDFFDQNRGTWFGFVDMFSGGNLSRVTVFALGIMPYISASIILQLLTVVWPYLEKLSKEGELGRKKITQYTRYGTVLLAVIQSGGIAVFLQNTELTGGLTLVANPGLPFTLMTVLTLTAGTVFIMWLGEQITERGIGNGMSLLIFAGIVVNFPAGIITTLSNVSTGQQSVFQIILLAAFMVAVVGFIVHVERAQRRIPVQYAKRVVGRKMYQGQSTHLPLKVNTGGVIPVIFASSIIALPQTVASMFPNSIWMTNIAQQLAWGMPLYTLLYVTAIVFFCYFYTAIIFNPDDVADNMRKFGGYVPGIRPGKRTAEYIDTILTRLTFGGAIYLAAVSVLPEWMIAGFRVAPIPLIGPFLDGILPNWITEGLGVTFYFGGTSLLIIVGVAMDTVQQIESQLIMRHYDGFMKRGRIRGRRG
ncbi:MAG: preprotein translocase subunit SecY [Acidobacteria bacterium]|nr:MAG: preprotein translocase subunit SecY [Acidobacteriota bacterium]